MPWDMYIYMYIIMFKCSILSRVASVVHTVNEFMCMYLFYAVLIMKGLDALSTESSVSYMYDKFCTLTLWAP